MLSMPLIAHEVSCSFVKANSEALMLGYDKMDEVEKRFRVRCLLLDDTTKQGKGMAYTSPYDLGVYSVDHTLRMAGAVKAAGGARLTPVDEDGNFMVEDAVMFDRLFRCDADSNDSFREWMTFSVSSWGVGDDTIQKHMIESIKPRFSPSYPKKMNWWRNYCRYNWRIKSVTSFDKVYVNSNFPSCKERRNTWGCGLDSSQCPSLVRDFPGALGTPTEDVSMSMEFVGEDGVTKPFRMFGDGDFFYHGCQPALLERPNAVAFPSGYYCTSCETSFGIVKEYVPEEKYHCERVERSEDASARMGNMEWQTELHGTKFFILSAPMGSGKTFQMAKLIGASCVISMTRELLGV